MKFLWLNVCILIFSINVVQTVERKLDYRQRSYSIPEKDRQEIEILFNDLIKRSQFGYTIFGDKPVSIMGYFISTPFGNLNTDSINNTKKRWEIWKQHKHLFPMRNYLLFDEPTSDNNLRVITLLNIEAFIHKFNQHLALFKEKLGEEINADKILRLLNDPETEGLFYLLNQDEKLYGILLGYGEKSASIFKRFFELDAYLNPFNQKAFSIKKPKASDGFGSINDEYIFLREQFIEPKPNHVLCFIQPVCFMAAKKDPETQLLMEKYRENRRRLSDIYKNKSFMMVSLEKLCSP